VPTDSNAVDVESEEGDEAKLRDSAIEQLLTYAAPDLEFDDNPRSAMQLLLENTQKQVRECYNKYLK